MRLKIEYSSSTKKKKKKPTILESMGKSRSSSWSKISGQKDGGQKVWVKGDQLVSVHHKNRTSLSTTRGILHYVFGTGWAIVPSNFCLIMLPNVRPLICLLFFMKELFRRVLM